MAFCFDTSALLECWSRSYPIDIFPGLWSRFDEMIAGGEIVAPDEVHEEIKKKDDDLTKWVQSRSVMFAPLDAAVQRAASETLTEFPELVKALSNRNQADPFVVGLARVRGVTVVTQERGGTKAKPRIPAVCEHFKVECIDVLGFIRLCGWTFE